MFVATFYMHPEGSIMEVIDGRSGNRSLRAIRPDSTSKLLNYLKKMRLKIPAFSGTDCLAPAPVIRKRSRDK